MTEDTFPPADEEELEAANALRQALEGRPAGSRVPEEALQTAAFLRHAGDGGRLSSERRAKLREQILASLPAAPARAAHRGWRSWLGIGITLLGASSAALAVGVLGVREWGSQDRASEARARVMETAAYGDESSAPERGGLAAAPRPSEWAEPRAVTSDGAPSVGQPAAGGLAQAEREAPATDRAERRRASAPGSPRPAASSPAASSPAASSPPAPPPAALPRAQRAQAPAFARKAAPADTDDALGWGEGSGLAAAESKGRGAPASGAGASAPAAAVRPEQPLPAADASSERRRQERRRQLLARLADTRVSGAYLDADRAASRSELERARERLSALSSAGLGGTSTAAEAEQLRPDVHCRLAELALRLAQPRAALDWTRQGLALGTAPTPFVACLYQQQGRAQEALGDRDGAAQSYMSALRVNELLLDESLEGR